MSEKRVVTPGGNQTTASLEEEMRRKGKHPLFLHASPIGFDGK